MKNAYRVGSSRCLLLAASVCIIFSIAGCATTEDLRTVQADLNEARRIAYENRNKVREISDRIAISETGRQAFDKPATDDNGVLTNIRQSQAELGLRLEDLYRETRSLLGRLDEMQYNTEQALNKLNDQKDLLMIRISALEERFRLFSPTPSTQTPPLPTQPAAETASPGIKGKEEVIDQTPDESALALYKRGHNLYKSKDFVKARETFKAFLEKFPNHEYAGNAQFWIGETYYSEKDYENAILAYEDVLRKYRQSEKVPAAMLKQGYAFVELGDERTARVLLDGVEKKFPGTHQAELAKRKLKAISKTTR